MVSSIKREIKTFKIFIKKNMNLMRNNSFVFKKAVMCWNDFPPKEMQIIMHIKINNFHKLKSKKFNRK